MSGRRAPFERRRGEYLVSTDAALVDLDVVHGFLVGSYWAAGVPRDVVARSIEGSIPFGLYRGGRQAGFARVVSDRATFAWLADVFVLPEHRGRGLGRWLVATAMDHPDLRGLRRWMLATRDAHGVYGPLGFTPLADPGIFLEVHDPDVYRRDGA